MARWTEITRHSERVERAASEGHAAPLTRFVLAVVGLIAVEAVLVVWLWELPTRRPVMDAIPLIGPSIIVRHPKGPFGVLLLMLGFAMVELCRKLTELRRAEPGERQQRLTDMKVAIRNSFFGACVAVAGILIAQWKGV
jgi:hypothetical protein